MPDNYVCHKCLNLIHSDDLCQKSNFEYFHMACANNDGLIDVTDQIPDWDDIDVYENIILNSKSNKFNGKFIDLSSKKKLLELYRAEKIKTQLKKELKELEQIDLVENFNDFSSDDFIIKLNKNIELLDTKYLKNSMHVN